MLKVKEALILGLILMSFVLHSEAQVLTKSLRINGIQFDRKNVDDKKRGERDYLQNTTSSDTIGLPFFDDFSGNDLTWVPSRDYFSKEIHWIGFFGNQNARAFGDKGLNLKTNSRGSKWEQVSANNGPIKYLSISFPGSNDSGWACGSNGWLAKTVDGGQSWITVSSPSTKLKSIAFQSNSNGLLIDSLGKIYYTNDAGVNWNLGIYSSAFRPNSVAWVSGPRATAVGDSCEIGFTTDGGINWTVSSLAKSSLSNKSDSIKSFRKVKMIDGLFGLAVGDSGMVYKTLNGAINWFKCKTLTNGNLLDVDADPLNINHNIAWSVGTEGTILYSGDGGNSWVQVRSGFQDDFLCLDMVNEFRGFIGSNNGRILQLMMDPTRPESRWWEKNSGVFINNTFVEEPISMGVATFDGLNNLGLPYSNVNNQKGACDTLTSIALDLDSVINIPTHLTFWYQKGGIVEQILPDPEDLLAVQFKNKNNEWEQVWSVGGESIVTSARFKYAAVLVPDSFKYKGFQFRFINYGVQNGNYDLFHIDYVRLDTEHGPTDSLEKDFGISVKPTKLLKDFTALPLEQFKYCMANNLPIFNPTVNGQAFNLNPGIQISFNGLFYLKAQNQDTVQNLIQPISSDNIDGMLTPFLRGYYRRPLSINTSLFTSSFNTIKKYSTVQYGFGLNQNTSTNQKYLQNDTLLANLNISTVMANDDGSAELVRGVSGSFSQGAVKFYLPVTDTITDIALNYPRLPFNFQQTVNFTLILYDSINPATNFEKPIFRLPVILPTADSANKFDFFSLRIRPLAQRTLQGGKHFYIGWEQGVIDNRNEVLLGCDINTRSDSTFYFKEQATWKKYKLDNYSIMIRPIFGPEIQVSVKDRIAKTQSPFFPNPAKTSIQNKDSFANLSIFNQLGQVIVQEKFGEPLQNVEIKVKPGFYIARWQDLSGNWQSQRLIIE
jgi:photosystem II stability/assembly factor-like uncharacterized protein